MDGCLYTSVTEADRAHLATHHPEAAWTADRLAPVLAQQHPDVRVLAVMIHDPVPWSTLAAFPRLEAVVTRSDGFDHLPMEDMARQGVAAYHLEGYATQSVAELALMSILAGLRRLHEAVARTRAGAWDRAGLVGRRLDEVTVGLLGTGRIGGRVARMLSALGANVRCHDLLHDPEVARLPGVAYAEGLPALLASSDVLSLHVPLDHTTRRVIDREALARLPRGAVLVNTARGDVVDQRAVADALDEGRLSSYIADVLPEEPRPPALDRPLGLGGRPDVLLTPHLGAHTAATLDDRFATTARIAKAVLAGRADDMQALRVDVAP